MQTHTLDEMGMHCFCGVNVGANGSDVDLCVLPVRVSQVFDVETSGMLFEIKTNRLSSVQYCHACPTSNLLAIAFSNYAVEVKMTDYYINLSLVINHVLHIF